MASQNYFFSNIKTQLSQITNKIINLKKFLNVRSSKMWQRHKVNKCCWEHIADRLAWYMVFTNSQSVKKHNTCKAQESKSSKMRYICSQLIHYWNSLFSTQYWGPSPLHFTKICPYISVGIGIMPSFSGICIILILPTWYWGQVWNGRL